MGGLGGPGFRFFTGVGVFTGRSPRVRIVTVFFDGLEGPGFRFFTARARGARVQDFHWRLEGPGFRFFTGFSGFPLVV